MKIGIPKELKNHEYRVGATPSYVAVLVQNGHEVFVQKDAGLGSSYPNELYVQSGAKIVDKLEDIYFSAELIIKIKEPLPEEYSLIKAQHIIFTYFHFSANKNLLKAMQQSGAVCIAYETIKDDFGGLPLLAPMSEIAGRLSIQQGAYFLNKAQGGTGVLLSGIPGVARGKVVIIGGGVVGKNAALMAAGLQADVVLMDLNMQLMRNLEVQMPLNVKTVYASRENILQEVATADLIVGAVLIPGSKAPKVLYTNDLKIVKQGAVLVDVAIDQGGCFESAVVTSHDQPVVFIEGIQHYGVPNMPGAVPITATKVITHVSLPFALSIANNGWEKASRIIPNLLHGLAVVKGDIVHKQLIEEFKL